MPFLRAAIRPPDRPIERVIPPLPEVISGISPAGDAQLKIPYEKPKNEYTTTETEEATKTDFCRGYEDYVGSLYKKEGYIVYNGREKGSWDKGIDLICKKGNYTILVRCKNYEVRNISFRDICYFYGASQYYRIHHLQEVFWTTQPVKRKSEVFKVAVELGILLYENAKRK